MKKLFFCFFACFLFLSLANVVQAKESVYYESKAVKFKGGTRNVNAVYVDLNDKSIQMESVVAKNTIGATDDLKNIANQASDSNTEVVAAINGTFFNSYTDMKPWGTIESEGSYYRLGSSGSVIGFTPDNKPMIETLRFSIKGSINESWDYPSNWYAWDLNAMSSDPKSIVILNSAYGKTTGKHSKTSIVVDNRKVISIKKGEAVIPANGYVIVTQDTNIIGRFNIGYAVDYKYETTKLDSNAKASAIDWSNVRTTVGAGPTLLKAGVIQANGKKEGFTEDKINKNRSQRSFAGYTKKNTLILATVPNVTVAELAEIAKNMGCQDALNLDGGASSGLYYRGKTVSSPGRKLSNALVVTRVKNKPPRLVMNGISFISKNEPYTDGKTGELMVPVTDLCSKIYAHYTTSKTGVKINKYTTEIDMTFDSCEYTINGQTRQSKSPPVLKNGIAYIPLRIIADLYEGSITYNAAAKTFTAKISIVNINELMQQAKDAKAKKQYEKAIGLHLKILALDPENKMSHYLLGYLYSTVKNNEQSIYHFKEFLKFEPENAEVLSNVGWRYYAMNDMPNAIVFFKKSLDVNEENTGIWIVLAQCYQNRSVQQFENAVECYNEAKKHKPSSAQLEAINKGVQYCQQMLGA